MSGSLSSKSENALDEARMLILGAQVLIGFDYQAFYQPVFDRLPPETQQLKMVGLGLMLFAAGLLLAPGAYHRIVDGGSDSPRLIEFTSVIASVALLPFALDIGLSVYLSTRLVLDQAAGLPLGMAAAVTALIFWYGLEWLWRRHDEARGTSTREQRMPERTPLEHKIKQVLTEARVVLPGAQALLGFQLTAMLTDAFEKLPKSSQYVHLASLGLIALAIVFLMAPAAFHRIVERGEDTERVHRFASVMVLAAMVPLALGMAGDLFIVADKVVGSTAFGVGAAVVTLVFFFGLWFGVTLAVRARVDASRARLQISQAAR